MLDYRLPPWYKWDLSSSGIYAAYNGNSVPTFRENLWGPNFKAEAIVDFLTLEYGTDRLSLNGGAELPFYAA